MSKGKHGEAEIIGALKHLEAGRTAEDVARDLGVSKHTIYAWKAKYGGLDVSQAQQLRQLTDENHRQKELVGDLNLDKEMPKDPRAKIETAEVRPQAMSLLEKVVKLSQASKKR
jgi:putative transposase